MSGNIRLASIAVALLIAAGAFVALPPDDTESVARPQFDAQPPTNTRGGDEAERDAADSTTPTTPNAASSKATYARVQERPARRFGVQHSESDVVHVTAMTSRRSFLRTRP